MRSPFYSVKTFASGFCAECCAVRTIYSRRLNHRQHALLTVATLGFWSPLWLEMWLKSRRWPWKCEQCRERVAAPAAEPTAPPWEGGGLLALGRFCSSGRPAPRSRSQSCGS